MLFFCISKVYYESKTILEFNYERQCFLRAEKVSNNFLFYQNTNRAFENNSEIIFQIRKDTRHKSRHLFEVYKALLLE